MYYFQSSNTVYYSLYVIMHCSLCYLIRGLIVDNAVEVLDMSYRYVAGLDKYDGGDKVDRER